MIFEEWWKDKSSEIYGTMNHLRQEYIKTYFEDAYEHGKASTEAKKCHVCNNLGYTARFCHNCGGEANPPR